MKKIAMATLVALIATASVAAEIGVTTTRDYSGSPDRTGYGVTIGNKIGPVGVTAGFDR